MNKNSIGTSPRTLAVAGVLSVLTVIGTGCAGIAAGLAGALAGKALGAAAMRSGATTPPPSINPADYSALFPGAAPDNTDASASDRATRWHSSSQEGNP